MVHLLNPIAGALVAKLAARRVAFTVGLCHGCCRKRRRAFYSAGAVIGVSILAAIYGLVLMKRGMTGEWVFCLGILSMLGGLAYGLNASTLVTARRITEDYFWLKGVHPGFLADLPDWPGEHVTEIGP